MIPDRLIYTFKAHLIQSLPNTCLCLGLTGETVYPFSSEMQRGVVRGCKEGMLPIPISKNNCSTVVFKNKLECKLKENI